MIELMVVVGIVAILALMTLPSYLDKFSRDQITEALPIADVAKAPIALAWGLSQTLPADNAGAGLPAAEKIDGKFVSSISIAFGAINITLGNRANGAIKGKVLALRPVVVADTPIVPIAWICGYANVPDKMTVMGENRTSVPVAYLPISCRQ